MRISLPIHTYTQLNTNPDEYLIQNLSSDDLHVLIGDTQPTDNEDHDYVIERNNAISGSHMSGICWGKPSGKTSISVGITEG